MTSWKWKTRSREIFGTMWYTLAAFITHPLSISMRTLVPEASISRAWINKYIAHFAIDNLLLTPKSSYGISSNINAFILRFWGGVVFIMTINTAAHNSHCNPESNQKLNIKINIIGHAHVWQIIWPHTHSPLYVSIKKTNSRHNTHTDNYI